MYNIKMDIHLLLFGIWLAGTILASFLLVKFSTCDHSCWPITVLASPVLINFVVWKSAFNVNKELETWTVLLTGLFMHVGTDCSWLDERTDLNNLVGTIMINQQPCSHMIEHVVREWWNNKIEQCRYSVVGPTTL